MKRSRRQNPFTTFLNRILKLVLLMLFCVATAGSGVVYLRHQITNAAQNVKQIESQIRVEERRHSRLGAELAQAMATDSLVSKIDFYALSLYVPEDHQIIRVTIDPDQRLLNKTPGEYLSSSNL